MGTYLRPASLADALAALTAGPRTVLAGGTDHFPVRATAEPDEDILDITAVSGLRGIERTGHAWRIGALTRWSDVGGAALPPMFGALQQAARQIGGRQVQNAGTVAGNLCNASPAADGIPPLLALDATVQLASAQGSRRLPLAEFVLGPRRTARRPDELLVAVHVPHREAQSLFLKLGARHYLVISISMVALLLQQDAAGRVTHAAAAVGACGPAATRLPALERALLGHRPAPALLRPEHLAPLSPIDDVRAPAAYRLAATQELLRRALAHFASPAQRAA